MIQIATIIAARKRGWTTPMIAAAAGVTHQAIDQRLRKSDEWSSLPKKNIRNPSRKRPEIIGRCLQCGGSIYRPLRRDGQSAAPTKTPTKFCSYDCSGKYNRTISDKKVLEAIELRRAGNSWTFITKTLRFTQQGLQRRIWAYLNENGLLTHNVVLGIWSPPVAKWRERSPSWIWLERKTGLTPRC